MGMPHRLVHERVLLGRGFFVRLNQDGLRDLVFELISGSVVECFVVFGEVQQHVDPIVEKQRGIGSDEDRGGPGALPVDDAGYAGLIVDVYVTGVEVGVPEPGGDELWVLGRDGRNCSKEFL